MPIILNNPVGKGVAMSIYQEYSEDDILGAVDNVLDYGIDSGYYAVANRQLTSGEIKKVRRYLNDL